MIIMVIPIIRIIISIIIISSSSSSIIQVIGYSGLLRTCVVPSTAWRGVVWRSRAWCGVSYGVACYAIHLRNNVTGHLCHIIAVCMHACMHALIVSNFGIKCFLRRVHSVCDVLLHCDSCQLCKQFININYVMRTVCSLRNISVQGEPC